MKSTILQVELRLPDIPTTDAVGDRSFILQSCTSFPDQVVLGFAAPGLKKAPDLGRLFNEIEPRDGKFLVELAAVLQDRLPSPPQAPEYVVQVGQSAAHNRVFCVSNVMTAIRYTRKGIHRHSLCPARYVERFMSEQAAEFPEKPHVSFLPTLVGARYEIAGADAEDALSEHLEGCIDDFLSGINQVVTAHLMAVDLEKTAIMTSVYARGSFDSLYVLIAGAGDALAAHRISTHLVRTSLTTFEYSEHEAGSFLKFASGELEIDDVERFLRTAESYIQAGVDEFAFLLTAIAAEIATTRFVHSQLRHAGVSKTKLEKVKTDLTFSVMLNTQVMALAPDANKPDRALLAQIDEIRKVRNDLMHEAEFQLDRKDLISFHRAALKYVTYLRSADESRPNSALRHQIGSTSDA